MLALLLLGCQAATAFARVYPRDNVTTIHVKSTSVILQTATVEDNTASPITTGLASASSCAAAKNSWINLNGSSVTGSSTFWYTSSSSSVLTLQTSITHTAVSNSSVFTLCDGFPRLHVSTSVEVSQYTSTSHTTYEPGYGTSYLTSFLPAPTCSIGSADCNALNMEFSSWQAAYNTSRDVYDSWYGSWYNRVSATRTTTVLQPNSTSSTPVCGKPTLLPSSVTVAGPPVCFVRDANIQLLYWPVKKLGNLCDGNATTMTIGPTIAGSPNTVTYWDTTLTSPTVYVA